MHVADSPVYLYIAIDIYLYIYIAIGVYQYIYIELESYTGTSICRYRYIPVYLYIDICQYIYIYMWKIKKLCLQVEELGEFVAESRDQVFTAYPLIFKNFKC